MKDEHRHPWIGALLASTGVICPCHVLAGAALGLLAAVAGSAPALSADIQDGVHAIWLPVVVLFSARLFGVRRRRPSGLSAQPEQQPAS